MKKVIITKHETGTYSVIDYSHYEMWNLGIFLTDETNGGTEYWKKFVLDKNRRSSSGNIAYLIKQEDNICIGYLLAEDSPLFCLPSDYFIKVLDQWQALCDQKVSKIIITQTDDGKINFEVEQ